MAEIELRITAASASDLLDTVNDLASGFGLRSTAVGVDYDESEEPNEIYAEEPVVAATQDADKPKRTRRTRAEIDAEKAAQQPAGGPVVAAGPTTLVDPAALAAAEAAVMGGSPAGGQITYEQLQETLKAVLGKYRAAGKSPMSIGALLKEKAGAESLSTVDPSRYADAMACLQAELVG